MKLYSVTQVAVTKVSEQPLRLFIQADGLASTTGWKNPRLDGSGDPNPADAILEFSFEADRPTGIVLQMLTPISAALQVDPPNGAEAVTVIARTNQMTVHVSNFQSPTPQPGVVMTTLAVGEEGGPFTTHRYGEEFPPYTTLMLGEETHPTFIHGEGHASTWRAGEEGVTTRAIGEEGPTTNPQLDDPAGPFGRF